MFEDHYNERPLIEGEDYVMDPRGYRIFLAKYHVDRGYCCGNGCRHCPFFPKHMKGNRILKE